MGVYDYAFPRLMTSVEEESVEEIFPGRTAQMDCPDGLKSQLGKFFPRRISQMDYLDGFS